VVGESDRQTLAGWLSRLVGGPETECRGKAKQSKVPRPNGKGWDRGCPRSRTFPSALAPEVGSGLL
jgi:hypothetical protein